MVYDGDGNRVAETAAGVTTKYLVDTLNPNDYSQVLDELVSGAATKTYTYGLQPISENQLSGSTWTPTFYGYDGHGNVRFTTSTAGTVGNTYQFDAFGAPIASTGAIVNTYLYSGERFDSNLNLYHLRARYYNMLTGRFETIDPRKETSCTLRASQVGNIFGSDLLPCFRTKLSMSCAKERGRRSRASVMNRNASAPVVAPVLILATTYYQVLGSPR